MRVLVSATPAFGHLLPLLPLARELQTLGHDVAVMSAAGMRSWSPGTFLPVGVELDVLMAEARRARPLEPGSADAGSTGASTEGGSSGELTPEGIGMFFGGFRAAVTAADALDAARAWAPDLVLGEGLDGVGLLVATELDRPHVTVGLGPVCSSRTVDALRAGVAGVATRALAGSVHYDPWPATMRPPGWSGPEARPMRTTAASWGDGYDRRDDVVPDGEGPAVLLSLGTIFDEDDLLLAMVDALTAEGYRVAATTSPRSRLTDLPSPRARLHRFAPIGEMVRGVDAVVCHGGAGTVLAAAAAGRPLVVAPQGADHPLTAAGVEAAGLGLAAGPDAAPQEIAALVAGVVGETGADGPRTRARAVATEIAALPGPDAVARELGAAIDR